MKVKTEKFKEFIESIERQSIQLEQLHFKANPNIEGKFSEPLVERKFEIDKIEIAEGEAIPSNNGEKLPFFRITYTGSHKDSITNIKDIEQSEKTLLEVEFTYSILLVLSPESSFNELDRKDKEEILNYFSATTGKLMIFPYLRHLIHFLSTEAGLQLPPINPLLVNPKSETKNKADGSAEI